MDFRWLIGITLWTFLAGPVFDAPFTRGTSAQAVATKASK